MIPGAYAPPVETGDMHGDIINSVYRAIKHHSNPVQMASYGKMLAQLLADQAKFHAGGHAATGPASASRRVGGPQDVGGDYGENTGIIVPPHRYLGPPVGAMDDPIANAIANQGGGYRSAMPILDNSLLNAIRNQIGGRVY